MKKLLTLPIKVQRLVHGRELSIQAATSLADLPPDEQAQVLATLLPGEQPVSVPVATEQPTAQEQPVGEHMPPIHVGSELDFTVIGTALLLGAIANEMIRRFTRTRR